MKQPARQLARPVSPSSTLELDSSAIAEVMVRQLKLLIFQVIQARPLMVWMAVLGIVLAIATIALRGLLSPGPLEVEVVPSLTPTPAVEKTASIEPQADPTVSAWLLGTLALGCIGSSLVVARQVARSQPRPQPARRRTPPQRPPVPRPQPQTLVRQPAPLPVSRRLEPLIAVLPSSGTSSLSWEETNLADLLDIRKRQPLSAVLRPSR